MRVIVIIAVCLTALVVQANAATQTSAITSSNLVSTYSESTTVRTISENTLSAPDLNYKSSGQVDAEIYQPGGGAAVVNQGLYFSAENSAGLGGMASFYCHASGTQVKDASIKFTGVSTAEVWNQNDRTAIISDSFGLGMAKPGDGEYDFSVSGNYITTSNTVPALIPIPVWEHNGKLFKELEFSFEQFPMDMGITADVLQQDVSFNYAVLNNEPTSYAYDFSRNIVVEDTTCNSWMSFSHLN